MERKLEKELNMNKSFILQDEKTKCYFPIISEYNRFARKYNNFSSELEHLTGWMHIGRFPVIGRKY
jgi:hypothetical protein